MVHTHYENLSDESLYDLFHSSNWNNMTADDRRAACQEVANRDALSHGAQPCPVVAEPMSGYTFGFYSPQDGQIHVNSNVLEQGAVVDANGNATSIAGSNAETLDTLFHENSHAYDAQLAEALENMDNGLAYNHAIVEDAQARGLDMDSVRAGDAIYVSSDVNGDVYRTQPSEKAAFNAGEKGTAAAFAGSQERLGADPGYQAYADRLVNADEFNSSMANLTAITGDKDFDKTLDEQAKDIYFSDHKSDDLFTYGTPESRSAARGVLESTPGAQYVNTLEQVGIQNSHSGDIIAAQQSAAQAQAGAQGANAGLAGETGGANAGLTGGTSSSYDDTAVGITGGDSSSHDSPTAGSIGGGSSSSDDTAGGFTSGASSGDSPAGVGSGGASSSAGDDSGSGGSNNADEDGDAL